MMPLRISHGMFLAAALALATCARADQKPAKGAESKAGKTAPASTNPGLKTDAAQQHFDSAQTYQLAGDLDSAAKE